MRERLLASLVGLTLLTVLLYGVPRVLVRTESVNDEARREAEGRARAVAEIVETRVAAGLPVTEDAVALRGDEDRVLYRGPDGVRVLAGPDRPVDGVTVSERVSTGVVEVTRPASVVRQDVADAVQPIVLTGAGTLAAAALLAVALSLRLARPFQLLAASAADLGRGKFDVELPPLRVREAEGIATALRTSAVRVSLMLQRQRGFARNASHQLRTPLTALRLRVEDVSTWPETPATVRAELEAVLAEVDRLTETVGSLLSFSRDERMTDVEDVVPADVVRAAVERWRPLAAAAGREVVDAGAPGTVMPLPRVAVEQVLDVLVDNALKHGSGTVRVSATADEAAALFVVADEGELPPDLPGGLPRRRGGTTGSGEGIGLSLCADLAQALGGRLRVQAVAPATFALELPVDH